MCCMSLSIFLKKWLGCEITKNNLKNLLYSKIIYTFALAHLYKCDERNIMN